MTLLEEIARLLEELALGTYDTEGGEGDVFLGAFPSAPDLAITLSRHAGGESDALLPYDEPVIRVRVRGNPGDAVVAESRAQAVYDAMHGLAMRRLPGGTWLGLIVGTQGGPVHVGRDETGRDEWAVNFRAEVYRPTANRR